MESQGRKAIAGVIGSVLGIIGLVLAAIWWSGIIWLLKSALPLIFLGLGLHLILKAFGTSWQDLIARVSQIGTEFITLDKLTQGIATITLKCPNCGAKMPEGTKFCLQCGNPLPQPKICPRCQTVNVPEATFCGHCGIKL